jgi:hypothetical protein
MIGWGDNTRIYIKDGEYYAIDFYNDRPCEKQGERGYIRGEYPSPKHVELKSRQVVEWYFLDKEHDYDIGTTYRPHSVPITGQVEYDLNKIVDIFYPPV